MEFEKIKEFKSLEELLSFNTENEFPDTHGTKKHLNRYMDLAQKFANYPVEEGAMQETIKLWLVTLQENIKEINSITDAEERAKKFNKLFEDDPIIFLNRHDVSHTKKVMEKALELIKCFSKIDFSGYEIYFLLCAIVVHDIGNLFGRMGHEKKIAEILDSQCNEIIPDSIERRIIGVHGGEISGNSDTISILKETNSVYNFTIKERLLASILRFADELADDATRANYDAIENNILGDASKIYHIYSEKLHTVTIRKNDISNSYEVFLAYQFDSDTAKILYGKLGKQRYLLDEIYSRTIKMERERRYCIRYLRPYCSLERINVEIIITKGTFEEEKIAYTLEEKGYPPIPFSSIKDVRDDILTGEELAKKLEGEIF